MSNTKRRKQAGFTLIELLVVISIIGLLASVVLASLQSSVANAQDAARLETTQSVANSLELYNSANGHYPIHTTGENISVQKMASQDLSPYMPAIPSNFAVPNQTDYYVSDASGTAYELLVAKQSSTPSNASTCNASDYEAYSSLADNSAYCLGTNVSAPLWTPPAGQGSQAPGSPTGFAGRFFNGYESSDYGQAPHASLSWSAPASSGSSPVTSYNIYNSPANTLLISSAQTSATYYTDSTYINSAHSYYITAVSVAGESAPSPVITIQACGGPPQFCTPL